MTAKTQKSVYDLPMTALTATVKFNPIVQNTQRGRRANVLVTLPDNREGRIWGDPDDARLMQLQKGQTVHVLPSGKNFRLAAPPAPPVQAPPEPAEQPEQGQSNNRPTRQEIEHYVQSQARLFRFCYDTVAATMQDYDLTDEHLRAIASGLHIAARRRFLL